MPLAGEQELAGELELELGTVPATILEAIIESCFVTCSLPQFGHRTPSTAPTLRTNSSKGFPHSWQINSKIGIDFTSIYMVIR
jgi:hypothetical protein